MLVCFSCKHLSVGMPMHEEGKEVKRGLILMREFGQRFNRTSKLPFHLLQTLLLMP